MRRFEWDDEKEEANWRKHGIRFEKATEIFKDPNRFTETDNRFDYSEDRLRTTGMTKDCCMILFVVHTQKDGTETIRIISARRATRRERRRYGDRKI
jgi:uncharacterized protein